MFGELVPVGGGDSIPLLQKKLRVGRREGCDIILAFLGSVIPDPQWRDGLLAGYQFFSGNE